MGTDVVIFAGGCEEEEQDCDAAEEDGTADVVGARRCPRLTGDVRAETTGASERVQRPRGGDYGGQPCGRRQHVLEAGVRVRRGRRQQAGGGGVPLARGVVV